MRWCAIFLAKVSNKENVQPNEKKQDRDIKASIVKRMDIICKGELEIKEGGTERDG